MVKETFGKMSKRLKILWPWLSAKFSFAFMSISTGKVVKNSHILTWIFFIFLRKNILHKTWNSFNTNVGPKWNDQKSSYQARPILAHFFNLFALILGWKCVKCFRGTKIGKNSSLKEPGTS